MPTGGHARVGPAPDPRSGRSDRRGLAFDELPADGYDGEAPGFPLPSPLKRERELWVWAWRTPQAAAWAAEPWRWLAVAAWVRQAALCEKRDAKAADKNVLRQLGDDIGLSPAGLRYNGWTIAKRRSGVESEGVSEVPSSRDRFEVISGGGA